MKNFGSPKRSFVRAKGVQSEALCVQKESKAKLFSFPRAGVGTHSRRASVAVCRPTNTGRWRVQNGFPRRRVGTRKMRVGTRKMRVGTRKPENQKIFYSENPDSDNDKLCGTLVVQSSKFGNHFNIAFNMLIKLG